MRKVVQESQTSDDVDRLIDYLLAAWNTVPEYAQWWPDLDASQQEVIHLEWIGITEARFPDLNRVIQHVGLSSAQQMRYDRLIALVESLRPTIDRLLQT